MTLGRIRWRAETDRHGNAVSLIALTCGPHLRMVHHTDRREARQRATIFAERGKSIHLNTFSPNTDRVPTTIHLGGYSLAWRDGYAINPQCPISGPNITTKLRAIRDDDFAAVILLVLTTIVHRAELWDGAVPLRDGTAR